MRSYEWHVNLKDVDVKPGSRFILEYGISQYLFERLEIRLQGGHAWQSGEDSGSDVYWDTSVKDPISILDGGGVGKGGSGTIYVDGKSVATARIEKTQPLIFSTDKTTGVGLDNQTPVALGIGYGPAETKFNGGINKIVIEVRT